MSCPNRRCFSGFAAVLLAVALTSCTSETGSGEVSQDQVATWIDRGEAPLLLDVRTAEEYAAGHVPGAMNIPHDQLPARVGEIEARRGEDVVVYCESGRRAAMATETLHAAGFTRIRHLVGDMSAWRDAGLPTEPGPPSRTGDRP